MDQARTPMKSRDKPCAVDRTSKCGRNDWDLNFIISDPDPTRKTYEL